VNELVEKKIASIIQSPELRQFTNRDGKALQINVQILGNDAIDRACAEDGDIKAAMRYILSVLPQPKMGNLKLLAIAVAFEAEGSRTRAARSLNLSPSLLIDPKHGWTEKLKAIQNGEITFKMPERIKEVQQNG